MNRLLKCALVFILGATLSAGCESKEEKKEDKAAAEEKEGEGKANDEAKAGEGEAKEEAGGGEEKAEEAVAFKCEETNAIEISGTELEHESLALDAPFVATKTAGWISGMQGGGKTHKVYYIGMANYDEFELGSFSPKMPKNPGEVLVQIAITSEFKEAEVADQKTVYAGLTIEPGDYPFGSNEPKSVNVNIFKGGSSSSRSFGQTEGKAVLTQASPNHACGTIDLKTAKGATVKGSFAVALQKDMWK